jgi:excisionase family DNA binding protein
MSMTTDLLTLRVPVDALSPEEIPAVLGEVEELRAVLWRMMLAAPVTPPSDATAMALLTIPEVASALRFSRGHVYELVRRGDIPAVRQGRTVRVTAQALAEWKTTHRTGAIDVCNSVSLESPREGSSSQTRARSARPYASGVRGAARRPRGDGRQVGNGRAGHEGAGRSADRAPGQERHTGDEAPARSGKPPSHPEPPQD